MNGGLEYWDANGRIGRSASNPPGVPDSVEALLATMDEYGLDHALVHHAIAKENSPALGNQLLGEAIAGQPRLHACWVVLPPATRELPPPVELLAQMRAADVRAVRLCPRNLFFLPTPWALRGLLEPLEAGRVPVFLDFDTLEILDDRTDWQAIFALGSAFPNLPLVLVTPGLKENRISYPLLDALPNLRLELSTSWQYRRVEEITKLWGHERLLFGTNLPLYDPGGTIACLAYAEVGPAAQAAIAGGNLRNLLAEVRFDGV